MKKSKFDLTHLHSTTLDMGNLVPFYLEDCLPNDTFRISMRSVIRAQPMVAPLMHEVRLYTQYFFVPYRLLWDEWIPFITGGESGKEAPAYPYVKAPENGWQVGSLADYFGFPINQAGIEVSAMPFRAMAKIWNDHYLKDDIDDEKVWLSTSGEDTQTSQELLKCHWKRDRFTEAKPFTQRGSQISVPVIPSVTQGSAYPLYSVSFTIPSFSFDVMGATSSVSPDIVLVFSSPDYGHYQLSSITRSATLTPNSKTASIGYSLATNPGKYCVISNSINLHISGPTSYSESPVANFTGYNTTSYRGSGGKFTYPESGVSGDISAPDKVDLGSSGAINIRDLRTASAMQRVQEASMKYGFNYEDYVQHEFKLRPRDSRLQKSEYIGGGSSILQISEVLQTSEGERSGVGSMAGHGIASMNQRRIRFTAPEHGCIIGLLSIRPDTTYTQGIERAWLKRTRWEFFTKELADIGAQEILQQELYANKDNKNVVFGYDMSGNYREYRNRKPMVTGNFRSDLSFWNLARNFESAPSLNSSFCEMNPSKRPFAITDSSLPAFVCMLKNIVYAYRPIPRKSRNILK